jgi:hypothetical protein
MAYIERRIALDHERDSDIINFLDSMTSHKGNKLIRELLRDYIRNRESSAFERIDRKLDKILHHLENVSFKSKEEVIDIVNEDDSIRDLMNTLDNLGK